MVTFIIKDRFNKRKNWTIKRYSCGHYYANFIVNGRFVNAKFKRTSVKSIELVLNIKLCGVNL